MTADYPEEFNIAEYFLDARIQEGRGDRIALRTDTGDHTYADVQQRANRFGHVLWEAGVQPGQRVIIALPDGPEYIAALFGVLKVGAVVVMVNPDLKADAIGYFYGYTGAGVALIHADTAPAFERAAEGAETLETLLMVGSEAFDQALEEAPSELETFPSHRDDPAIWLFSGGTTGQPKAVVQPHRSFANTTDCYAKATSDTQRTTSRSRCRSSTSVMRQAPISSSRSRFVPPPSSIPNDVRQRCYSKKSGASSLRSSSTCLSW